MVVAYGFMFSKISMNETVAAIIIILAYAVKTQAQNLPYSASVALVSDLSNDQNERLLLSTRRAQWLTLGNIVFSAIVAAVISFFTNVAGSMLLGYSLTAVAFGFFNWAANFVTFKVIRYIICAIFGFARACAWGSLKSKNRCGSGFDFFLCGKSFWNEGCRQASGYHVFCVDIGAFDFYRVWNSESFFRIF